MREVPARSRASAVAARKPRCRGRARHVADIAQGNLHASHGFFVGRKYPDYGAALYGADRTPGLIDYVNVPKLIGALVSGRMATLIELQMVYGILDAYNLLEIQTVDNVNHRKAMRHAKRR